MQVSGWENHRTKAGIFQHAMFYDRRVIAGDHHPHSMVERKLSGANRHGVDVFGLVFVCFWMWKVEEHH